MRYLIVNADDFGYTEGVNRGILDAHDEGIVTSASLMVERPAAAEAAAHARERPGFGVGLHVELRSWRASRFRGEDPPGRPRPSNAGRRRICNVSSTVFGGLWAGNPHTLTLTSTVTWWSS